VTDISSLEIINDSQWWVTPLAIILSAAIAAFTAWRAVRHQREIARMRATLDVILESESNAYYQKIYASFASESKRSGGLVALVNAESDAERKSRRDLHDFLNHYELIAIAIKNKILDERFYKDWMKSTYIKHYDECSDYIMEIRKSAPLSYVEFESLANKWRDPNCKC
jgi:hypothetical protein